jgi:hypothetical protein
MSFSTQPLGSENDKKGHELPTMPWDQHPSIFEFVNSHIAQDKPGLTEDGYTLPDDERVFKGSRIRWVAGAMDGVTTYHMAKSESDEKVRNIVELVLAYTRQPTAIHQAAVYNHIVEQHIVSMIDPVIEALLNDYSIDYDRLYELANSFATESPDREPVKFGIAILGLFRRHTDQELFQTLGRHDEFTLFCAVALANADEHSEEMLWTLARNVYGWGRIHVVERLASTGNPAIKDWLLREGFRNSVMYEYLAGTCASAGGLLAALSESFVDRELLTSAGEIIRALISGGPVEGIDHYEDARPVLELFLKHMEASAETIQDFLHVNAIKGYLDEDDSQWEARLAQGWTNEYREKLRAVCDSILQRTEWADLIQAKLGSENEAAFCHADQAARAIGIDTWEVHWQRLQQKPADPGRWYNVMVLCDENRIERVIEFAERTIDLESLATGAANEVGFGRGFEQHRCLGFILQELERFPGRGAKLIDIGLRSPVIRNRNMAVAALAACSGERLSSELRNSLEQAGECEPDDGVRDRMQRVLRGESLSP